MQLPKLDGAFAAKRCFDLDTTNAMKIGSKYLVTNRYGCHAMLSEAEYRSLLNNDLDEDLHARLEAAGVILTDNNRDRIVEICRAKNESLFQGASLHIVVPTLRCNQCCVYCHAASKPKDAAGYDMDEETAKKTVDFIFQTPSPSVTIEFQGGEPLLNLPIVKFIVAYANKANLKCKKSLRFSIVTNLTLMTDEILQYLINEKVGICTSLDGPREVHNANRKYLDGSGSYDDVIKWIRKIKEIKPLHLNALTVVTRYSLSHPREIVDELVGLGFPMIWTKQINYLGYATNTWKKIGYTPEEYADFYKKIIEYIVQDDKKIRDVFTTFILTKVLNQQEPNFLDLQNPCGAAIGQLAYNYDGSIYSCDEGRMIPDGVFRLGSVEQSYREVICSRETCSLIQASINDIYICDSCVFKPYCGLCPVCTYSAEGTLIPKLPLDSRCRILKMIFSYVFYGLEYSKEHRKVFEGWAQATRNQK
jgi:uncharacterized protein